MRGPNFQIAVDGPGGAGKSTAARAVAAALGFDYIDTGALYRAVGLYAVRAGANPDDADTVAVILPDIDIAFTSGRVMLNGEDVTEALRTPEAGENSSRVAVHVVVRERMTTMMRRLAEKGGVVMDGRDIGTFVLPNAQLKIYMDADSGVRAERRCAELEKLGMPHDYGKIKQEIEKRDERDKSREAAPLKKANDAVVIDTSCMTAAEVVEKIIALYNEKSKGL